MRGEDAAHVVLPPVPEPVGRREECLPSSPLGRSKVSTPASGPASKVPRHYRACSRVCGSVCARQHQRPLTHREAPTLTCTRIRTDHMCPPAHTQKHTCANSTHLFRPPSRHTQLTPTLPHAHTRTPSQEVSGRASGKWCSRPLTSVLLWGPWGLDPAPSSGGHRAPATHAAAEASGTFTALGVLSSGTLN